MIHAFESTLASPEENLAFDEALLGQAEAQEDFPEILRLWELPSPVVIVGSASRIQQEVNQEECLRLEVPLLRRASGGLAIVAGRGCLMYSLILDYRRRPHLRALDEAHRFVLDSLSRSLAQLVPGVHRQGISDLTCAERRKFSGNSVRCKRDHVLYHGTLLYDFPLDLIGACLKQPPRQPDYRNNRSHLAFVTNLPVTRNALIQAVVDAFGAKQGKEICPYEAIRQLVDEKYSRSEWNYRS